MIRLAVNALIFLLTVLPLFSFLSAANLQETYQSASFSATENSSGGLDVTFRSSLSGGLNDIDAQAPLSFIEIEDGEEIPVYSKLVAIPSGYRAVVNVKNRLSFEVGATQMSNPDADQPIKAHEIASRKLTPANPASVGDVMFIRGVPVASLHIFPYQMGEHGMIENRQVDVEIEFIPDVDVPVIPRVNDMPGTDMARMMDKLLLNPPQRDVPDLQMESRGKILILYRENDRFEEEGREWVDSLAVWKRQMGYEVEILSVNTDVIRGGLTGREIRSQIIRPRYNNGAPPISYLILIGDFNSDNDPVYFPTCNHTELLLGDHYYTLMVDTDEIDDDYLSDIAVGRINVRTVNELAGAVNRSILYEREPYVEDGVEWFTKATYLAENIAVPGGGFVESMYHLGRWVSVKMQDYGYTWVDTIYIAEEDGELFDQLNASIEDGKSTFISRGWLGHCVAPEAENYEVNINTGRKNPFTLAVTCLSSPSVSGFFRAATRNNPNGPIVGVSLDDLSHSKTNNSFIGGLIVGMLQMEIPNAGILVNLGKYQLFHDNRYELSDWALPNVGITRVMGDPTAQIFTRVPQELSGTHVESVIPGARGLTVEVSSDGDRTTAESWVCIYQDDGIHYVAQPGGDGFARFTFEPGELEEGDLHIVITDANAVPYFGTVEVAEAAYMVEVTEIEFDNNDDLFGNGETIPTTLTLENTGGEVLNDLNVELFEEDHFVSLSEEQIQIGNLNAGATTEVEFDLVFDRASYMGRVVRIQLDFSSGDHTWEHAFNVTTSGHLLSIIGNPVQDGDEFVSGGNADLLPILRNSGNLPTPRIRATLVSNQPDYVRVVGDAVVYDVLGLDDESQPQSAFSVELDELAISGNNAAFTMILEAVEEDDSFADTVHFDVMIETIDGRNDPFGPDEYGYICFDSGDTDWEKAPEYDWIELNPTLDEDFEGVEIPFEDYAVDLDETAAIELPFSFSFYGQDFDTVSICTNGWLAFGADKSLFPDFRNQQIPGIQGPDAMVAVFWQDLLDLAPESRGVFYYYDEERGRFIIEWSNMKIYIRDDDNPDINLVEFQAILYDPTRYPTSTGDGEIKLQYKTVIYEPGDQWDNWYFTTGIKNVDGSDGLEYCYWGEFPDANMRIEDETALFFTTDRVTVLGGVTGRITDRENPDRGLENVRVRSTRTNVSTTTDNNGEFELEAVPAGRDDFELSLDGYNTMYVPVEIEQDQVARIDTSMTYPTISASTDPVTKELQPHATTSFGHYIENEGNGPLEFEVLRRYHDGREIEYELLQDLNISALVGDENYMYDCQLINDSIYVAGASGNDGVIYVFNRAGEHVRTFPQPTEERRGFIGLTWNGANFYGVVDQFLDGEPAVSIVEFDLNGEASDTVIIGAQEANIGTPRALTLNFDNSRFYISNNDGDVFVVSAEADSLIERFSPYIPGINRNIKGFVWNEYDEDGMKLYAIDEMGGNGIRLLKIDPESQQGKVVTVLHQVQDGDGVYPSGATLGFDWERSKTILVTIAGGAGRRDNDHLHVYDIGPDTHFLTIEPEQGRIEGGAGGNVIFRMDAADLLEDRYEFGIVIEHNAAGDPVVVPMTLIVDRNADVPFDETGAPHEFTLFDAYPNPFNGTTVIRFSLPSAASTKLSVFDINGRLIDNLVRRNLEAGSHQITFKPDALTSGIYFYRLEAAGKVAVKRMVYVR